MKLKPVTDPAILQQLQPVTDPRLLAQLNAGGVKLTTPISEAVNYYDPTEGMSKGQQALAGSGKFFVDVSRGAKQLAGQMTREEVDEAKRLDAPLMKHGAAQAGNIGTGALATVPLAWVPGANTLAGSAAIGGALGAVQPVGTKDSRGMNVAMGAGGGAVGHFGGRLLSRIASPVDDVATPAIKEATANLRAMGGRVTPGQATQSAPLRQLEASAASFPPTAGPMRALARQNEEVINRATAGAIGEKAPYVDKTVIQAAEKRIGQIYDRVASPKRVVPIQGDDVLNGLVSIEDELKGVVPVGSHPLVQETLTVAGAGQANGAQLQALSRRIRLAAQTQLQSQQGDRNLGHALMKVRDIVDDLLAKDLPPAEAQAFAQAREQYRNLMSITATPSAVNLATGRVNPVSLGNVLSRKERPSFVFGKGQPSPETERFYQAIEAGQAHQPIVGDSGTPTRSFLPWLLGASGVTGAGGFMAGGPAGGVAGAAAPAALAGGANLAARAYTSKPGTYLMSNWGGNVNLTPQQRLAAALMGRTAGAPIGAQYLPGLVGAPQQ